MPQELVLSLPNSTAKTARVSIFKISLRTVPRCGVTVLILLCMGLYFLFPASQTFQQIQDEKSMPFELTATTNKDNIDLNALKLIENVERVSPILKINTTLAVNEYKLDCEIIAVYSSFLSLEFVQGIMYSDRTNMPYLILNKAAAEAFSHEYQTITVSPEDTVIMDAGGTKRKAIVCGIFNDRSEIPVVYMSYDVSQREYGVNGETNLVFLLNNIGSAEKVVTVLQRQNIHARLNPNLTLTWELLQKQCWQTTLLSIALLACSIVLICEKRSIETSKTRSEKVMLLLSGMMEDEVERIFLLRIILTGMACVITAALIAVVCGTYSLIAVGLSMGLAMCVLPCVTRMEFVYISN